MENLLFLPSLNKSEQFELVKRARTGDDAAKTRLIMSCGGLVKKRIMQLANENSWCYPQLSLIYDDLLNSGFLGVTHALEKFDISQNTSFSSYSFFWIDAFLRKELTDLRKLNWSREELDETITDDKNEEMFDAAFSKILCEQLLTAVGKLEREIIILFFGINCRSHTLTDIAKKYGFTFQYVGKIKQQALQKMRNKYKNALKCA